MNHLNVKKNLHYLCVALFVASQLGQPVVRGEVIVTPVGTPLFDVVDTHLLTAATDVFPSLFPTIFRELRIRTLLKSSAMVWS